MKEISCPKCGSVFKVDEADYASIVHQVKNAEFRAEIDRRMAELNKQHQAEERANALQSEQTFREKLSVKELEIGKKNSEIDRLKALINSMAQAKELELKAELAKKDQEISGLKAAIALPGKMFESTSVGTCILLFDKDKTSQDVMLVNAEEMASKVIREQRGEGEASHYNRIYRKELNSYTDEQIAAVCELTWKEVEGYSKRVSLGELAEKNYSLSLGPYLPIYMEGPLHRDFNAIIADINRVIRERNVVKLTVNKVWAKKLGLEEVIEECNANNEIVKAINESLQLISNYTFKEKIIENKYIQSSHSKVLTIENTDKDILSSIMPFFMSMYKQHIFYLNLEENRLLAELRDSMLPFLMNGQLEVKGGSV